MGLFPRKVRPAFVTAPVEPPVPDETRIGYLDTQARWAYLAGDIAAMDSLIDQRNAIRPAKEPRPVPVVPGRVDSIIDNYGENPW